jgi:hypothetical protein
MIKSYDFNKKGIKRKELSEQLYNAITQFHERFKEDWLLRNVRRFLRWTESFIGRYYKTEKFCSSVISLVDLCLFFVQASNSSKCNIEFAIETISQIFRADKGQLTEFANFPVIPHKKFFQKGLLETIFFNLTILFNIRLKDFLNFFSI